MIASLDRKLLRALTTCCLRLWPTTDRAVVYSSTPFEGNATETIRFLLGSTDVTRVTWLLPSIVTDTEWRVGPANGRLRVVRRKSLSGFVSFLRARYVFFTNSMFGGASPGRRRIFVNLWHGDGPKRIDLPGDRRIGATVSVSGAECFSEEKSATFGVPNDRVFITGNPRIDQFRHPATDSELARLGIDPARGLVVWAPTYRDAAPVAAARGWQDGARLSEQPAAHDSILMLKELVEERDLQLIVKPHPSDVDDLRAAGLPVVTDVHLAGIELHFYRLLGRAAALVTDYSSVWVDYVALRRPVGFLLPDLDAYTATRGLARCTVSQPFAGARLTDAASVQAFLDSIATDPPTVPLDTWRQMGIVLDLGATSRLFQLPPLRPLVRTTGLSEAASQDNATPPAGPRRERSGAA